MGRILTEELVKRAIELVRPSAEAILYAEGTTWGPRWVEGWISGPPESEVILPFTFGFITHWQEEWGEEMDFHSIADSKVDVAERVHLPTSLIIAEKPWLLEKGEYLYAGGTHRDGISVAVSGAKGRVDEAISEMVLSAIRMLAFLETERRIQEKEMQI